VGDAVLSTVRNAARLLKEFRSREESIGVSELARRLALGKSGVHRLLTTLVSEGLLEQDPRTGGYRLGIVMVWEGVAGEVGRRTAQDLVLLLQLLGALAQLTVLGLEFTTTRG
jgi:IclR family KDG regulon transcriptional repressor